jgi:hypothetical protein
MFRHREKGDTPLFRNKAVSEEICKKKGTVPFFTVTER